MQEGECPLMVPCIEIRGRVPYAIPPEQSEEMVP
jgi:hypothetical protein